MHVIGAGLCNRVDHGAEVASCVCRVGTVHDAEFLHPVLRGADALHPRDASRVIDAVEGEERSVALADAPEAELQHGLGKRRLCANRSAPSHIDRGRKQNEIYEVATGNGEVGNLGSVDYLAYF